MSDANAVIKQAAIDWFGADWRRAAGFGGYVLQQLEAAGYEVTTSAIEVEPGSGLDPSRLCSCGHLIREHRGNYSGSRACDHCACPAYPLS